MCQCNQYAAVKVLNSSESNTVKVTVLQCKCSHTCTHATADNIKVFHRTVFSFPFINDQLTVTASYPYPKSRAIQGQESPLHCQTLFVTPQGPSHFPVSSARNCTYISNHTGALYEPPVTSSEFYFPLKLTPQHTTILHPCSSPQ